MEMVIILDKNKQVYKDLESLFLIKTTLYIFFK